jgi:hypothetical protein
MRSSARSSVRSPADGRLRDRLRRGRRPLARLLRARPGGGAGSLRRGRLLRRAEIGHRVRRARPRRAPSRPFVPSQQARRATERVRARVGGQ